jgi:exodeoxyribonuclease V alpha subunit
VVHEGNFALLHKFRAVAEEPICRFEFAYAITCHKSQGSEYDCVIILLTSAAFIMLERNLVYTAVTRGKKEVIMMGEPKAYGMALSTQKSIKRNTKLIERLRSLI